MSQQVWKPVEDGEVTSFAYVDNGGKLLGVFAGDDYTDWYATEDLPDDIRLCHLTTVPDAPSVSVPGEVMEAMRMAIHFVDVAQDWNFDEIEMDDLSVYTCSEVKAKLQSALSWLERTKEGE